MEEERAAAEKLIQVLSSNGPDKQREAQIVEAANEFSICCGQLTEFSLDEKSRQDHQKILKMILEERVCREAWRGGASLSLLSSLTGVARLLLRDRELQNDVFSNNVIPGLAQFGEMATHKYFTSGTPEESVAATAVIRGFLSISQKLCSSEENIQTLAGAGFHCILVRLLSARDMVIVQATLQFLGVLAESSPAVRAFLSGSNALDQCLQLLKDSDLLSQKLSASLLRILCGEIDARESVKVYDGVSAIVGLLSTKNVRLQWHLAWTLAQLAEDEEVATEIGTLGAIPILLLELGDMSEQKNRNLDDWLTMLTGLTAVLAQLCQVDSNAALIVQDNGVYILCKVLLSQLDYPEWARNRNYYLLQCSVFRVLRLLFSLERNRGFFKRLFPPEFFAQFIDIGHYVVEVSAYQDLVDAFRQILETGGSELQASLEAVNQKRAPLSFIGNYAVLEQLGAGAFGCVYKVQKKSSTASANQSAESQYFALKEIFMHQATIEKEKDKSFGDVISEVKIIRQQLRHPNIVRYRRVFVEKDKLYILMDLIDGASLKDHISSVKEKKTLFTEERIWNILIQMVLAMRYLHKEKHIIHRDLKPNNVMICDNDRVVITDFGLAKQRGESYLKSTAGTILYSCPEILQNEPYGEKSDIWSLGCITYEMCALNPPFFSQNMLQLASAIVEARYEPISSENYSRDMEKIIRSCLTPAPAERPDVVGVAELMSNHLLQYIDGVRHQQKILQKSQGGYGRSLRTSDPLGDTSSSSLNASTTSFTSSSSAGPISGRGGGPRNTSETIQGPDEDYGGVTKDENIPGVGGPSARPSGPMKAVGPRPQGPVRSAAARPGESAGGGRPGRTHPMNRRMERSMSANALPVISQNTQDAAEKAAAAKKFAWQDQEIIEPLMLPTIRRANSSSIVDKQSRGNMRVHSAGSTISISSAKLRPIQDPILELLSILHRVMFVSLLPPSQTLDHKRRVIEQFGRALFNSKSSPLKIKAELRKLLSQSTDMVSMNLGYTDYRPVLEDMPLDLKDHTRDGRVQYLTYEQLYGCLEMALAEKECSQLDWREHGRAPSRILTPSTPRVLRGTLT